MFSTDRDLAVLDPSLFRDVGWVGQRLVNGFANISGTTLTLTSYDTTLDAAGVTTGHIAQVDGAAYEVIARLSPTTATISRIRASIDDATIPPAPVTARPVQVWTFAPQIALAHRQLLAMLGLDNSDAITNPADLRECESLGTLYMLYSMAAGPDPSDASLERARLIRDRYSGSLRRAKALLDLNGDGEVDAIRRPGIVPVVRS